MTHRQTGPRRPGVAASGRQVCPICGKPTALATRPFCSRRCADVDLSRWLGGAYRVPVSASEEEGEDGRNGAEPGSGDDRQ